ncbi:MAG: NAD+ synthase [Candidatus Margulisbacteria bacterium]|nr:NAD+ synthase [Candidatus Margulisiibacteriota bacterium]
MKLALAQINPTVGDLTGNTQKILAFITDAKSQKADLIIFPELAITGYPPEDLLLKPQFIADNLSALREIVKHCRGIAAFIGFVDKKSKGIFNAGAFIENGKIKKIYHKVHLPNYAVFDEKRYFTAGKEGVMVSYKGLKIGLGICEDIWAEKGPYLAEARKGADLIININASPYHIGKIKQREKMLKTRAKRIKTPILYVNMVGGQDELVFDGGSMVVSPQGKVIAAAKQYREELLMVEYGEEGIRRQQGELEGKRELDGREEVYEALVLGVKDYTRKNGIADVVVGLSGGIDSALVLTIAADALGPGQVHAVYMPSPYSAKQSLEDAAQTADNLGVKLQIIPISDIFADYLKIITPSFAGKPVDVTEENLQARIRGNFLMALSNKFGWLVLTTGNKSEMSCGYCTLYGDMAGGFAVVKDVPKTVLYQLVDWRNQKKAVVPQSIIQRAPTAELKPNQTDQDTLPPYAVLDQILKAYVEENKSLKQIIGKGIDGKTARAVINMIDRSEYKRRQSPPGPRITPRAFGKDWRLPITNRYS